MRSCWSAARVVHAARSEDLLADTATLDRYLAVGGGHVH